MLLRGVYGARLRQFKNDGSRWPDLFGIELELESPSRIPAFDYWTPHDDGSLRNGIEFVLREPYGGATLEDAINEYYNAEVTSNCTERASTHIHINMTDSTVENLRSMLILMYVIEGPLFAVVGEARKWCGYAMPLSEMEPTRLLSIMQSDQQLELMRVLSTGRNQDRYYGLNISSLRKWGTAEFRYFPGDPTKQELTDWLDLVYAVKKAATSMTPQEIVDKCDTPDALISLLRDTIGEYWTEKLVRASSVEEMFDSFNAIAVFVKDADAPPARNEPLMFLTPALVKYTVKNVTNGNGKEYLEKVASELNVLTRGDWSYHVQVAAAMRKKGDKVDAVAPPPAPAARNGRDPFRIGWDEIYADINYEVRARRGLANVHAAQIANPFAQAAPRIPEPEDDADGGW